MTSIREDLMIGMTRCTKLALVSVLAAGCSQPPSSTAPVIFQQTADCTGNPIRGEVTGDLMYQVSP